jgi:hypothetical protein
MRIVFAALFALGAGVMTTPAQADPYKWCAQYSGAGNGGATNCYFVTYEQCRAAVSGVGGFCVVNGFYDGRPVVTPEESRQRRTGR